MQTVKIKRSKLIGILTENRDVHADELQKALVGYRNLVVKELDKMLEAAKTGGPIVTSMNLRPPQDHTEDYDQVLAMLDLSVDDDITLTNEEFRWYVLDDWGWSKFAKFTNSSYAVGSAPAFGSAPGDYVG